MKIGWLIIALLCISTFAAAGGPDLGREFNELNNVDPVIRENAREALMGISRSDLDALRNIVAGAASVTPEQAQELHEIVMQVVVDAARATGPSGHGFLGAQLSDCQVMGEDHKQRSAVLVARCLPGYDAFRILRTDDVILAVNGNSLAASNMQGFMVAIQSSLPGQVIHLHILRGGAVKDVDVQLLARPAAADNIPMNIAAPMDPLESQYGRVEKYWQENFEAIAHVRAVK